MRLPTVSKRRLDLLSAVGAALILGSWLFQNLYAEKVETERRHMSALDEHSTVYHATTIVLDGVAATAATDDTKRAIATLQGKALNAALRPYTRFISDVCTQAPQRTAEERRTAGAPDCNTFAYAEQQFIDALSDGRGSDVSWEAVWEQLVRLPDEEFKTKLKNIETTGRSLTAIASLIRKKQLDDEAARNRVVFVTTYVVGSVLAVGCAMIKGYQATGA
jgi:hypothetical protein